MKFRDLRELSLTEAVATAHSKTTIENGAVYFHGFLAGSKASDILDPRSGTEGGIAFLPAELIAVGFDFENRGRIISCMRKLIINSEFFTS